MGDISFNKLSSTRFEELCYDLITASGFVNVDWRKGTGFASSPADRGRDIVCDLRRTDPDGSQHFEKYFVDCKHFKKGVPPKELHNLLAWAEAERPDVAVFALSNFLSNSAKDYIETYKRNNHPPFKIKCWEKPTLVRMLQRKRTLQRKYKLTDAFIRSVKQIIEAENEFFTRVWYGRSDVERYRKDGTPADIIKAAIRAQKRAEKRFGKQSLMDNMKSDWDWGFVSGKLSAIRWVLGDEWDNLDS
ncbi:MAG: restriction endonuclease [Terriglobales bacterium]